MLELGGKSASLVFPDADLDAVAFIATASVHQTLAGQGCALATRLVVHDRVYDELAERAVGFTRDIKLGDPFDPSTGMGPVVSRARAGAHHRHDRARPGGRFRQTARSAAASPAASSPTASTSSRPCSATSTRAASSARWKCSGRCCRSCGSTPRTEALEIANATSYGLASYIWTKDIGRINRLAPRLEAGGVYVNGASPVVGCELPFGGVGISGFGREGGLEGLTEFVRTKAVAIA